jgi:hypothetical protein
MKVVVDDLAAVVEWDGWLYRYETTSDSERAGGGWRRVAFFTNPLLRRFRPCPTRLFVGRVRWAFSSCRYTNGAVTDTIFLRRGPTHIEAWDPWLVRSSGQWWQGKLPIVVGVPPDFRIEQIAASGPFLAIYGVMSGQRMVGYRAYNADLVGLHPLLQYTGQVDWRPGWWRTLLRRVVTAIGLNVPPLTSTVLPDVNCWTLVPVQADADERWTLDATQWPVHVAGTYEITLCDGTLDARRVDDDAPSSVGPPTLPPMVQVETDYEWLNAPLYPTTHFDQCVAVKADGPIFCRLSLLDFLRADGDGTVVRASGVPVSCGA